MVATGTDCQRNNQLPDQPFSFFSVLLFLLCSSLRFAEPTAAGLRCPLDAAAAAVYASVWHDLTGAYGTLLAQAAVRSKMDACASCTHAARRRHQWAGQLQAVSSSNTAPTRRRPRTARARDGCTRQNPQALSEQRQPQARRQWRRQRRRERGLASFASVASAASLLLFSPLPMADAWKIKQPWTTRDWCEEMDDPRWPFAYAKEVRSRHVTSCPVVSRQLTPSLARH